MAGQGRDALNTNYTAGISGFQPFQSAGTQATGTYLDSLGLNGPEGNARATSAFQASPGFNFALDTGLNAIDRRAASRGMLGSGNTNLDTIRFATGLGQQDYGNWQSKLAGLGTQGLTAATGAGGLYAGLGTGLNNNFVGQGTQAYNAQTGIGNANAGAEVAKGNAETAASGNLWGALMGGAKLAAGFV